MLTYRYDSGIVSIQETKNENDVEFKIQFHVEQPYLDSMRKIQRWFEDDKVHTDVMFYVYENHEYHVIVRQDYYVNFVLALMKHHVLEEVKWT